MAQATGQQIITQATALALADGNTFSSLGVAEQMLYIHLAQQAMPTLQTTSAGGSILSADGPSNEALARHVFHALAAGLRLAERARHQSNMDRAFVDPERGFADRFGQCRMRMANAREILGRAAELHQHASLRDEFAAAAPIM